MLVYVSGAAAPGSLRVRTADVLVHGVTRPLFFFGVCDSSRFEQTFYPDTGTVVDLFVCP